MPPARVPLRDRLRGAETALAFLQEVYAILAGEPDLDRTLRHVVGKVARALRADVCAFLLYDEAAKELVTQPGAWGLPKRGGPLLYRVPVKAPFTSSGRVFLTKKPFLCADARNDRRMNPRIARLWNYRSLMVAPLVADGRAIGVLRIGHRKAGVFTRDDLRLAALVAEHAAVAVENARLYRRVREDVRELKRLSDGKTELLSTVSHELLSHLSSVEGFIGMLLKEEAGSLAPLQRDFLTICSKSLGRVTALIDDLLDASRVEAGAVKLRPEALDVGGLLESVRRELSPSAKEKRITLSVDVPAGLPSVTADAQRVRQVVDNLVSNALKFTPGGGSVALSARADGKALTVSVEDTGPGLSPAEKRRVFDRYYRTPGAVSRRTRGSGLGLAICKALVERHGGRIWVDAAKGRGSDFQFTLPLRAGRRVH